ncbi:His/Gly/Thr/Pro-type tRNA ligase C-terminal domain-containing protein, partial [Natronoarchaeum mannanilyticum]
VGERLDRAARERVPYVAVVGDRELDEGVLPVAVSETGREERLTVDGLRERVLAKCEGRLGLGGALPRRVGAYPSDDDE